MSLDNTLTRRTPSRFAQNASLSSFSWINFLLLHVLLLLLKLPPSSLVNAQQQCAPGKSYDSTADSCQECTDGKYIEDTDHQITTCKTCGVGQASVSNTVICTPCANGKSQNQNPATGYAEVACATCELGRATTSNSLSCSDCVLGQYQEQATATDYGCKVCSTSQMTVDRDQPCNSCQVGTYQVGLLFFFTLYIDSYGYTDIQIVTVESPN